MKPSIDLDRVQLGVCYYPEHWPESLWEDDFKRMKELGLTHVRLAEFAWSLFEAEEGQFQSDFFDHIVDLAHKVGLKVIMSTPTATPPAWLTHRYPEVLNVKQDGVVYQHGQRRHYSYNSATYQKFCQRIVRYMVECYKEHPAVVGWQIDNELNCETNVFYSQADHDAFRAWLIQKYGSLVALNEAWGTVFWNQQYTSWEQVKLSGPTVSNSPNPHLLLDEKRFFSHSAIEFARMQASIIREVAPQQWVTTNGLFAHLDNHALTNDVLDVLDFFSYDSYPQFGQLFPDEGERPLLDRKWSANLSKSRSISSNFCVMEQQSGPGGWTNRIEMPSPKPGQLRLWTYQSIAHGADLVVYFRWRTARFGTEIYWHGLNDYHNQPNRRIAEAEQTSKELARFGEQIAGSKYVAEVAILHDYDNEWDGELDNWHGPLTRHSQHVWFKTLQYEHVPTDFVYMSSSTTLGDLNKYELLIYPHAAILTDEAAQVLTEYVQQGGQIIFGARTGYKDDRGQCYMRPFPGPIADLCAITVEDFTKLSAHRESGVNIQWTKTKEKEHTLDQHAAVTADLFNDILKPYSDSVEILATYNEDYYTGKPALTKNRVDQGAAYYFGGAFSEGVCQMLLDDVGISSALHQTIELPRQVEITIRKVTQKSEQPSAKNPDSTHTFAFLLNYSDETQHIKLHLAKLDVISQKEIQGDIEMKPYDVLILAI